jgi:hypothetical protein
VVFILWENKLLVIFLFVLNIATGGCHSNLCCHVKEIGLELVKEEAHVICCIEYILLYTSIYVYSIKCVLLHFLAFSA